MTRTISPTASESAIFGPGGARTDACEEAVSPVDANYLLKVLMIAKVNLFCSENPVNGCHFAADYITRGPGRLQYRPKMNEKKRAGKRSSCGVQLEGRE